MKNQAFRPQNPQSGNVFFVIFLGIALFAGLTLVVSKTMRSGVTNITTEQAKLAAGEIIAHLNAMNDKVDELIIEGCNPLQVSFVSGVYLRYNNGDLNTVPPSSPSRCAVFYPNKQGIKAIKFEQYAHPSYTGTNHNPRPGTFNFRYFDVANGGTATHDLNAVLAGIETKICLAILNMLSDSSQSFSAVPSSTHEGGGNNTYTMGTPGTLNTLTLPTKSTIWALRTDGSTDYCTVGVVLKMN